MSLAKASIPQFGTKLRAWLAGVWQRTRRLSVFSNPGDLSPEQLLNPNGWFWARVILWEMRSFFQRIRFARERFSAPRCGVMDFLCQSCGAGGRSLLLYERKSLHASHNKITFGLPLDWLGRYASIRSNMERCTR